MIVPRMSRPDTKAQILDAAERLFAEQAFAAVSMRDITSAAGVNLAAVNYHFGSKDELLVTLFVERVTPLNRERAALLREAEAAGPAPIAAILHALLAPPLRWWLGPDAARSVSARFLMRAHAETTPGIRQVLDKDVGHLQRFILALARALPRLSHEEICWRLHFTLGLMHYTISEQRRLDALSAGACDLADVEAIIARAVDFAAAGFMPAARVGARRPLARGLRRSGG
jgi:AcrR family transcriptional regulator